MKIVNVTGVGNAGKGAVVDLLREFNSIWAPRSDFEFDFFRVYGGMFDFLNTIENDNSSCRTDIAIKRIKKLTKQMGSDPKRFSISGNLLSTGQRYDRLFDGKFIEITEEFLESLIWNRYDAYWPYERIDRGGLHNFQQKVFEKLGLNQFLDSKIHLIDNTDINDKFNKYISDLFSILLNEKQSIVVMNNFVEPYNINSMLRWFPESKSIAVIRDPRDIFISGLSGKQIKKSVRHLLPKENDGKEKSFLATNNIELFIERYKRNMDALHKTEYSEQLIIRFEDLIFKYEQTKELIINFIEVKKNKGPSTSRFFFPEKSKQNSQLWKNYDDPEGNIELIEKELGNYLYYE
jgi:hypothetical protein